MAFYDAHIHFFYRCSTAELRQIFRDLAAAGMAGFCALAFAEIPPEVETVLKMVPGAYHPHVTREVLENQRDPFLVLRGERSLEIIPYADVRFLEDDVGERVRVFKEKGFKGLKLLYVPEEDPDLRIAGMERAFGRSVRQSEEVTSRIIDAASSLGMPVLLHADLRRYGGFVTEMVRSHAEVHFNLPHFGSSRKAMSLLLDRYPNCYTDLSSLIPFMEEDPASYRDFIRSFRDRILFGSDLVIGWPASIRSTVGFVTRFLADEDLSDRVMRRNYRRFHGISGDS